MAAHMRRENGARDGDGGGTRDDESWGRYRRWMRACGADCADLRSGWRRALADTRRTGCAGMVGVFVHGQLLLVRAVRRVGSAVTPGQLAVPEPADRRG